MNQVYKHSKTGNLYEKIGEAQPEVSSHANSEEDITVTDPNTKYEMVVKRVGKDFYYQANLPMGYVGNMLLYRSTEPEKRTIWFRTTSSFYERLLIDGDWFARFEPVFSGGVRAWLTDDGLDHIEEIFNKEESDWARNEILVALTQEIKERRLRDRIVERALPEPQEPDPPKSTHSWVYHMLTNIRNQAGNGNIRFDSM